MQLSERLLALSQMVNQDFILADVGCDHGYIPIYLIKHHRIPRAIAMDIGSGPLKRAMENIRAYGLEGYIETRLSDGVEALNPGEADCVLISGMGGPLMEKILTDGEEVLESVKELILQPQSDLARFRFFLEKKGYQILQENMIQEDGKFYPMMKVKRREADTGNLGYSLLEHRYGPLLLEQRHPVLRIYLEKELDTLNKIVDNLRVQPGESAQKRLMELEEERKLPKEALKIYG